MIKEAYCSYEVSKLLKEKGFEGECIAYYSKYKDNNLNLYRWRNRQTYVNVRNNSYTLVPTHQMAMRWLREHGLHINAPISYDYSVDADEKEVDRWTFYIFEIYSSYSGNLIYTEEVNEYNSYEEAVEAAIKYCLENLI